MAPLVPAGVGAGDGEDGRPPFVPCNFAATAAAFALASAMILLISGFPAGAEPFVTGAGEPLFERDFL